MSQESKTPRTDAEASDAANYAPIEKGWYVHVDFACQLERELAAVTEERDAFIASARIKEANSGWRPIETRPDGISESYIVADAVRGLVAPWVRGVIHSNTGTAWDWHYGEAVTHWMPLPDPPTTEPDQ